jgi:hypothetical protein
MADPDGPRDLLRAGVLDAELAGLLSILIEARSPLVAVGRDAGACERVVDGLAGLLPAGARVVEVAPDDEFAWLPEATELGWRRSPGSAGSAGPAGRLSSSEGVLRVRGLGMAGGVGSERARIVVRALALGYGLLATMAGDGLDDALGALQAPAVGTSDDERSRLGLVLAVALADGVTRVTAAHHVRPVALDSHGHVQRQPPAVLATWNPATAAWDHFAWGVVPDLAGRLGIRPVELEREQARRTAALLASVRSLQDARQGPFPPGV